MARVRLGGAQGPGTEAKGLVGMHHSSVQAPTQHWPWGPHLCSTCSKSKNKQTSENTAQGGKSRKDDPKPLQMKSVTLWAGGRGR